MKNKKLYIFIVITFLVITMNITYQVMNLRTQIVSLSTQLHETQWELSNQIVEMLDPDEWEEEEGD